MIHTVVFDLGNVLVRFSHERMFAQMGAVCGVAPDDLIGFLTHSGLFAQFERGEVSTEQFHRRLCDELGRAIDRTELERAASDIFEPDPSMTRLLPLLRERGLRLVLLSNTCEPHIRFIRSQFGLLDWFDALVLSYEVGSAKPEPAIFESLLSQLDCRPDAAFYTDDIASYVQTGRTFGLQAETFVGAKPFLEQLKERGIDLDSA